MSEPLAIKSSPLEAMGGRIGHGFFTRNGGSSSGIYQSLNTGLGSDDDGETVRANRQRVLEHLDAKDAFLATPHQIHSPNVLVIEGPWPDGERRKADGVVTATPGAVLGILTADCGPVLFADETAGVVGAAHAGWRGAFAGVLENTIEAMESLGASRNRITAVLGPTISQANYEVGPEFVERAVSQDSGNERWFKPSQKDGHSMFDLPGYVCERLEQAGVEAHWTGQCTYGEEDRFYSYRRATHRGEPDYGRQISAILLR